ncbi:hypothetical protein GOB46_21195 [Sinorhizobium meliloti]|uniref:hypothetical protein n=1 Tax=Rhizobium meliloti TaxID=382 RepID=UPI00299D8F9D|nr:hypothetical protein [Sinorhizobium meliloti]MDW9872719.1 hypothetical protein [Sinorhizobium meliloti]MDW9886312.1 hypothetical protein [Sinorhizobium meliloti]MDX0208194.1 hypothetical protein [Sinorhizobium meliloti]
MPSTYRLEIPRPGDIIHFVRSGRNVTVETADDAGNFSYTTYALSEDGTRVCLTHEGNVKNYGQNIQIIRKFRRDHH